MLVPLPPMPALPEPVREVVTKGSIASAIDWIWQTVLATAWAGGVAGGAIVANTVILAAVVGYLFSRRGKV